MAVKMTTPVSVIDATIAEAILLAKRKTVRALGFLGEKCIIEIRDRSQEESWFDHSGNLRSSTGYVIVADGDIIFLSEFRQIKEGQEGAREGKSLAKKLASNYKTGYALIVVAGMNYAAYVEAMDNKIVLTSAELLVKRELPGMMRQLKTKIATL